MSRSTNRQVDPEVWFRIVHLSQEGHNGAPATSYRTQMVEIALGHKGAFENGSGLPTLPHVVAKLAGLGLAIELAVVLDPFAIQLP